MQFFRLSKKFLQDLTLFKIYFTPPNCIFYTLATFYNKFSHDVKLFLIFLFSPQECMVDHKDWRICQPYVQAFRDCIEASKKQKPEKWSTKQKKKKSLFKQSDNCSYRIKTILRKIQWSQMKSLELNCWRKIENFKQRISLPVLKDSKSNEPLKELVD
jgi:hypothetical protein